MFGKPEWFRLKEIGWGLQPRTWQGWGYSLGWATAISIPFSTLVLRHQVPESLVWLVAAVGLLLWDVWDIRRSIRRAMDVDLLYIGDGEVSEVVAREGAQQGNVT